MLFYRITCLFLLYALSLFVTLSPTYATPLTQDDYDNLQKRRQVERILYESYLVTDKGLASVFGYHFDTFFTPNWFFKLSIFGAVEGSRGGYGIAAYGLGYQYHLSPRISLDWDILTGSGGGGGLQAGGGLMIESHVGIAYHFTRSVALDIRYGYLKFLTGTFETPVMHFGLSLSQNQLFLPYSSP